MKRTALLCMLMMLVTGLSWAHDPPDVRGWTKTSWGMTEENIKRLFEGRTIGIQRQEIDDGKLYRQLSLKEDIAGIDFDVLFEMGTADNRLRSVRLVSTSALNSYFGKFEDLLTAKYGPPTIREESPGGKTAAWFLPSTKIELIFSHMRGFGNILNILYSDRRLMKKDLEKL